MEANASTRVTRDRRVALLRGIYAVLNEEPGIAQNAAQILAAGVRIVQYRPKHAFRSQTLRLLRRLTRERDAILILNDDWRRAVEFDCDGVHLGPGDDGFDRPKVVREAMRQRLIGLSCGTAEEIAIACQSGVDYVGVGPVFVTSSKADAGAPLGLERLRDLASQTELPVAAIGGINPQNVAGVRATNVAMAAVISALRGADAGGAAERLVAAWVAAG